MNPDEREQTFRRLGAISLLLGVLASIQLVLELRLTWLLQPPPRYLFLVSVELLLALAAILCGVGLLKGRSWALPAATTSAAAIFLHSTVSLAALGPNLFNLLFVHGLITDAQLCFRILLTAVQALFWPIVLGHVYLDLQCAKPEDSGLRRAKRMFWRCAISALGLCALVELLLKDPSDPG